MKTSSRQRLLDLATDQESNARIVLARQLAQVNAAEAAEIAHRTVVDNAAVNVPAALHDQYQRFYAASQITTAALAKTKALAVAQVNAATTALHAARLRAKAMGVLVARDKAAALHRQQRQLERDVQERLACQALQP